MYSIAKIKLYSSLLRGRILLQGFIETNHEKISTSSKLQVKIDKHYGVTKILFNYYKVKPELASPLIHSIQDTYFLMVRKTKELLLLTV